MTTKGILGKKVGMTQVFTENGELVPVTVVEVGTNVVLQVKTVENDGYNAIQLGFDDQRAVNVNKPAKGHADKAKTAPKRFVREIRDVQGDYKVGDEVKADLFEAGDIVDVTGTSKGHGFQGNIKRWGQSRGPMAHGSKNHREPGSIGAGTTPSRVIKGKRMAGNMGNERVTITKLKLVKVDSANGLVLVKGSVPGCEGRLVTIVPTRTKWN